MLHKNMHAAKINVACQGTSLSTFSYPEEVEVNLLRINIFFLVYTGKEIFYVDHHAQQSIQFFFRNVIQVWNMRL